MHMRNKALRYIFTTLVLSRFSADNPQTSVPPPGLAVPFDNNATSAKYPFYDLPVMECTKEIDDVAPILAVPWSTPTTGLPFLQLTTRVVNNGVQGLPSLGEALSFTSFEGLCTHMLQVSTYCQINPTLAFYIQSLLSVLPFALALYDAFALYKLYRNGFALNLWNVLALLSFVNIGFIRKRLDGLFRNTTLYLYMVGQVNAKLTSLKFASLPTSFLAVGLVLAGRAAFISLAHSHDASPPTAQKSFVPASNIGNHHARVDDVVAVLNNFVLHANESELRQLVDTASAPAQRIIQRVMASSGRHLSTRSISGSHAGTSFVVERNREREPVNIGSDGMASQSSSTVCRPSASSLHFVGNSSSNDLEASVRTSCPDSLADTLSRPGFVSAPDSAPDSTVRCSKESCRRCNNPEITLAVYVTGGDRHTESSTSMHSSITGTSGASSSLEQRCFSLEQAAATDVQGALTTTIEDMPAGRKGGLPTTSFSSFIGNSSVSYNTGDVSRTTLADSSINTSAMSAEATIVTSDDDSALQVTEGIHQSRAEKGKCVDMAEVLSKSVSPLQDVLLPSAMSFGSTTSSLDLQFPTPTKSRRAPRPLAEGSSSAPQLLTASYSLFICDLIARTKLNMPNDRLLDEQPPFRTNDPCAPWPTLDLDSEAMQSTMMSTPRARLS